MTADSAAKPVAAQPAAPNSLGGKLCLLCCQSFRPEVEAAVAAEGWIDVTVSSFPAQCGHPPLGWEELHPLVEPCTQVVILGRACLYGLNHGQGEGPPEGWPPVRQLYLPECFNMVAGATMVAEAMARGGYLMTPEWLADWRGHLRQLGFEADNARSFFREFARELVLLDSGLVPGAPAMLEELSAAAGLPATRIAVGLDYTRLLLSRVVSEWRLEEETRQAQQTGRQHIRERADYISAMDFLGQLALLKDEQKTFAAIEDMFRMLFAPREAYCAQFSQGAVLAADRLPPDLARQAAALDGEWAWTGSGAGFLLRLSWAGEPLGIVVAENLALPEFRERYLNLALSVSGVCALAIENARTYRRMKEAEEALRRSEQSLQMAQAIAHIGHWEWDVETQEMRWSDETYRILGYDPKAQLPSRDTFFQVIHPDDRARVASHIFQATHEGGGFDIEYRIVLPDGRVRVVHGVGEVTLVGVNSQVQLIGSIRDVTSQDLIEVLGVIQDITERKELELRLAQEAHTDALTGVANRRYFHKVAEGELARVRRYGGELSVFMMDLDHFKAINDQHGHHVGDLVLRKVVQVCRETLREEDAIGRVGGEEFAVLLPQTGRQTALEVAERLCHALAAAEVRLDDKPPLRFTASLGVATLAPDDPGMDVVLDRADKALYQAKHAGRNRVIVAAPG